MYKPGKPSSLYHTLILSEEKVRGTRKRTSAIWVQLWPFIRQDFQMFVLFAATSSVCPGGWVTIFSLFARYVVCQLTPLSPPTPPRFLQRILFYHVPFKGFLIAVETFPSKSFPYVSSVPNTAWNHLSATSMDTHDVSNVPEYFRYLQTHKQNLKNAQALKGRPAKSPKSKDEILMQFMFRQMMKTEARGNTTNIRSSFLPPAYPPCHTPFSNLSKVMIKDLCLETHHRKRYLLIRTVTPPDTMTAVMAIVEDEDGSALMLQLYNQEQELSNTHGLRDGTVLVVKEPYVKVMADGDYGIRVDHLSDVWFVPKFDDLVPLFWRKRVTQSDEDASSWKEKGSEHFGQGDYRSAIQW